MKVFNVFFYGRGLFSNYIDMLKGYLLGVDIEKRVQIDFLWNREERNDHWVVFSNYIKNEILNISIHFNLFSIV